MKIIKYQPLFLTTAFSLIIGAGGNFAVAYNQDKYAPIFAANRPGDPVSNDIPRQLYNAMNVQEKRDNAPTSIKDGPISHYMSKSFTDKGASFSCYKGFLKNKEVPSADSCEVVLKAGFYEVISNSEGTTYKVKWSNQASKTLYTNLDFSQIPKDSQHITSTYDEDAILNIKAVTVTGGFTLLCIESNKKYACETSIHEPRRKN